MTNLFCVVGLCAPDIMDFANVWVLRMGVVEYSIPSGKPIKVSRKSWKWCGLRSPDWADGRSSQMRDEMGSRLAGAFGSFPQRLKPTDLVALTARLKRRPFKTSPRTEFPPRSETGQAPSLLEFFRKL